MSNVVNFVFNGLGRMGYDDSAQTQLNKMNNGHASYMLSNPYKANDGEAVALQSQFPTMNMKGTHQVGPLGYNIDDNSKLLNSKLTNMNCKISLQERPYKTVPYLGKGSVDVGLENNLKFGDTFREKKSAILLEEKSQCDVGAYPMDQNVKSAIQNPSNWIEESAAQGWIRGGLPSRELYRDKDYQCN